MSSTVPKSDQIDFLVYRKFPNVKNVEAAYRRPKPMNPIGSGNKVTNDRIFAELELRYEVIQDYRKELLSKTPQELEKEFTREQAKAKESYSRKLCTGKHQAAHT
jgi:hypothetical protein